MTSGCALKTYGYQFTFTQVWLGYLYTGVAWLLVHKCGLVTSTLVWLGYMYTGVACDSLYMH